MTDYNHIIENIHLDHHYRGAKRPARYISGNSLPIINIAHSDQSNSAATKKFVDESVNDMKNYADTLTQSTVAALKNTFVDSVSVVLTDDDIISMSILNYNDEVFMQIVNGGDSIPLEIDGLQIQISQRVLVALPAPSVFNGIYTYNYAHTVTSENAPQGFGIATPVSGYVFVRTDYQYGSFIPHNLQVPVSAGDVYGHTIFSHMTPTASTSPRVGIDAIAFYKLGIADIHKVEGDNTGVASINATTIDLTASTINVNGSTIFSPDLTSNHILLNSYSDQGTEPPSAVQPSTLNGIYFRDPRPYLNQDAWGNYTTVNDNLCIRVAPVNSVGDTLVFSSYAGCCFMTQTNFVNLEPKPRVHLKNKGSGAVLEIDKTCDIVSNDVTGKDFFKAYITDVIAGDGSKKETLIPSSWNLNPNYTYLLKLLIYTTTTQAPVYGETTADAYIEFKTRSVNGNIMWHFGDTIGHYNIANADPHAYEVQLYLDSTPKMVGEIKTKTGEYYIGVFRRLY